MDTKERILDQSRGLFNRQGTRAVTTNHIAKSLEMSPGNLYFHFHNKEEILRQLFSEMSRRSLRAVWSKMQPQELVESQLRLAWEYRFFHREMYELRRRDPKLGQLWKQHLNAFKRRVAVLWRSWNRSRVFVGPGLEIDEESFFNLLLMSTAASLQVFESEKRSAREDVLDRTRELTLKLLGIRKSVS
ncbi:MAG: TetR/AcrR family transcriptional regulator [Bdellovibrio sp.]